MAKFQSKAYFKPTPKKFRIFGDAVAGVFLSASVTITMLDLTQNQISMGVFGCTAIAMLVKAGTNFFTDDENVVDPTNNNTKPD